jgi:ABC-type multidrug transport system fused ATPase/permease subunit
MYSGLFLVLGAAAMISSFFKSFMFSRSGEILTMRLREKTFQALLNMETAYFDDHRNNTGALCSRLASDASAVKGATGSHLGTLLQSFGSIAFGIVVGFVYSWKMTLAVIGFAPLMLFSGFLKMRLEIGAGKQQNKKMEEAAKVAVEAMENIRTVATLTQEQRMHSVYCSLLAVPYKSQRRKAHYLGIAYSCSSATIFFAYSASFAFGAYLVANDGLRYQDMFKVFSTILFGAMSAGQASSFAPDYGKAKTASARLFALFDRVPPIDSSSESGEKLPDVQGAVELRGVRFQYPTRPGVRVLRGLDITVKPGQVVALVGSSGCGKSTAVQLIERFYDPVEGQVLLDDHPVKELNLQWLRRQIGIVSQEPVLFDRSIRENIAYGDNFREVEMDEIIEAARKANIHNFIESLPQGYETNVGDKGAQLSGGQKQRIAIARALVRSPKILLLDEATSALDTESEKVVQEALERAQEGRTSIVIAHRLSTIQNADCIIVINSGRVAEVGTHSELLARKGIYHRLNTRQQQKNNATIG